ncbi:hypothetical protein ACP4OV_023113 [Aristida adscensionis]
MQSGPASPEQPPAAEPEAEAARAEGAAEEAGGGEQGREEKDAAGAQEQGEEEEGEEDEEEGGRGGRRRGRRRRGAAGDGAAVMVRRELLARCMTCPLCRRILRDATTISECLHTFCRKCIYKKLNDEDLDRCPVCEIDLGCTPVEKLRADHNIQDVRSKIFPFKRKKINANEVESPIAPPVKRKERSISSLVVNTPRITPAGSTGRRTRAVTRKAAALRGLGPIIVDPSKKDNHNLNKQTDNSSLLDSLSKVPQTRRQVLSNGDSSSYLSGKDKAGDNKDLDKEELWRPLNCLVEAASKTKPSRTTAQSPAFKGDKPSESPNTELSSRTKARELQQKPKDEDDTKDPEPIVLLRKKGPGRRRKHPLPSASSAAASQNEKASNPERQSTLTSDTCPLFENKADGNIPASCIQKYIMQKLNLLSESEVEISCCGQSVNPVQPVCNLVERWLRVGPARPMHTVIGSSGGDYVMVISYGRPK